MATLQNVKEQESDKKSGGKTVTDFYADAGNALDAFLDREDRRRRRRFARLAFAVLLLFILLATLPWWSVPNDEATSVLRRNFNGTEVRQALPLPYGR